MRSDKRPAAVTMADVAASAGVSRALVSIVFRGVPGASPETRQRVMEAAEQLSYRPDQRARLLGSHRSRTVGVVFGLHHEFHAEVVEALYGAAETNSNHQPQQSRQISELRRQHWSNQRPGA